MYCALRAGHPVSLLLGGVVSSSEAEVMQEGECDRGEHLLNLTPPACLLKGPWEFDSLLRFTSTLAPLQCFTNVCLFFFHLK